MTAGTCGEAMERAAARATGVLDGASTLGMTICFRAATLITPYPVGVARTMPLPMALGYALTTDSHEKSRRWLRVGHHERSGHQLGDDLDQVLVSNIQRVLLRCVDRHHAVHPLVAPDGHGYERLVATH